MKLYVLLELFYAMSLKTWGQRLLLELPDFLHDICDILQQTSTSAGEITRDVIQSTLLILRNLAFAKEHRHYFLANGNFIDTKL